MTDIHSCSYFCDRPECVKVQRDELRERLAELENQKPVASTNRCNIEGAGVCRCGDECINLVGLYLAAGAKPSKATDVEGHPV